MDSGVTKTQKIVTKPLKIDFHIHSSFSKYKDEPKLVKNGTKENIDLLLQKLNENKIEMCAITDHDYFSYDLYSSLKKHENENELLKVFPGVEFSVGFKGDDDKLKQVHVICVFDDEDDDKVKQISNRISFKDGKINYDKKGQFFSEEKFISILRDIDLNVITIAHQKQSVTSTSASKSKNDVSSLGQTKFNELISCEYFESYEFKNMKNGMFNKIYSIKNNKNYDQIRFITGSDCHDWNVYPKHDSNEKEDTDFSFTYLKCLPTFRGLAMAFSDTRRISTSDYIFTSSLKRLDKIQLSINSEDYDIELSPGINVIIGDNSIGKSLLLHKINGYNGLNKAIVKGYDNYLKRNRISIRTKIDDEIIHTFDSQGSIRKKFANNNQDNSLFLKDKFPDDLNSDCYKTKITHELDEKLYKPLETKFKYDEKLKELNQLEMIDKEVVSKNLSATDININKDNISKLIDLNNYYQKISTAIECGYDLVNDKVEKRVLSNFKEKINTFIKKYNALIEAEDKEIELKTNISTAIGEFNTEIKKWRNDLENRKEKFDNVDSVNLSNTIAELINLENNIKKYKFDIDEEKILPNKLNYGEYIFVKKFKNLSILNNDYLEELLRRVLKKGKRIDTSKITQEKLKEMILNVGDDDRTTISILKSKIEEELLKDLESVPSIIYRDNDIYTELSSGMNSSIYFNILSTDRKEGVYIVDQPEDDISQNAIKSKVLDDFKTMSNNRQIIMVTHNPQFVVNLDVDNVICIERSEKGEIAIKSGALEYVDKCSNTDILDCVAKNLDGGIESIQKRWKRYEKTTNFNKNK